MCSRSKRFAGNPLAVVLEPDGLDTAAMQTIAREFNLSETVFVLPPEDTAHRARIRIFTPAAELPFAGHPTVGTAVLLGRSMADPWRASSCSEEKVGPVPCTVTRRAGERGRAGFDLPRLPEQIGAPADDADARGGARRSTLDDIGFDGCSPRAGRRARRSRWCRCAGSTRSGAAASIRAVVEARPSACDAHAAAYLYLRRDRRAGPCVPCAHVRAAHGHSGGPGDRLGGGGVRRRDRARSAHPGDGDALAS